MVQQTELIWAAWANQNPEVITALVKAGVDLAAHDVTNHTVPMASAA
jgi:peptidoglycan/xylan/chitin deacetylase (PgdA/CDA1 family)